MARKVELSLKTADGVALAGTLRTPSHNREIELVAVINPGAGIPAAYYGRFAEALADRGIVTLTYDYRGIGGSRPRNLRGFPATMKDWGKYDAPAPLDWMHVQYPTRICAVIGHSIGGFLAGFVPDPRLIDRLVLVGAHTGYWRDYAPRAQPIMWIMWHATMPVVTRMLGYFPGRLYGLPQDLPAGVAYDWAARRRPGFDRNFRLKNGGIDHAELKAIRARFEALNADVLAIAFSDDPFATPAGTERVRRLMRNCRFEEHRIDVKSLGIGKIGHFGFFRTAARSSLWPLVIDWLTLAASQSSGQTRTIDEEFLGQMQH